MNVQLAKWKLTDGSLAIGVLQFEMISKLHNTLT